jgi:acyl-CoA dehydrogenase
MRDLIARLYSGSTHMDEDTGILALWRLAFVPRMAPVNNGMIPNYIAQHCIGLPRSY